MKKIVAAAAAGLLLASAAFADVSFSYSGSATMQGTTKSFKDMARYECLSLELSNDVAGVVCDWDTYADAATYEDFTLDQFYAWMDFALPVGSLEITSGKWNSYYCNRVKSLAGDLDAKYYELYKPGIVLDNSNYKKDLKLTNYEGSNLTDGNYSTVLAYTLGDVLPGKLMLKAGITAGDWYTPTVKENEDAKTQYHSGFCYEVAYEQADLVKFNFDIKNPTIDQTQYGVFVSPLMVEKLDSMVGFTYLSAGDDGAYGVDARASYAFTEKTSLTGMVNYSATKFDDSDKDYSSLWGMLSLGYTAGDNIRYVFTVSDENGNLDAKFGGNNWHNTFAISPACMVKASEKCDVTVGFDMRWNSVKPYSSTGTVSLPVYVSFSL